MHVSLYARVFGLLICVMFPFNRHFQPLASHRQQDQESWQRYKMNYILCLGLPTQSVVFIDQDLRLLVRDPLLDIFRRRRRLDHLVVEVVVEVEVLLKVLGRDFDVIHCLEHCHLQKLIMLWQLM